MNFLGHPAFVSPDPDYAGFDTAAPEDILGWATQTIDRIAVATSFQSSGLVILHMLRDIAPNLPVLFLDTGFHFAETLAFKAQIAETWGLKVVELRGEHGSVAEQERRFGPELFRSDPDRCCTINKVEPLQKALEEFDGWISGLRRDQSPLRAATPIIEAQLLPTGREVIKIHPLARWDKPQVEAYIERHSIPTHPLLERGFGSIGCQPCTRALHQGETERDGRWDGSAKTECGIHSFGKPHGPKETEAEQ